MYLTAEQYATYAGEGRPSLTLTPVWIWAKALLICIR